MLYQQPQTGPVALDAANPAALGASLLVSYGTSNENLVTGKRPDLQAGAAARYPGRYGVYDSAYSGGSGGADDRYSLPSLTDFALLAVVDYGQSSGSMASILGGDGSGNRGFQFRFDSSNNLQFIRFNTAESNVSCSVPASARRGVVLAISVGNAISVHFGAASASNTISGTPKAATRVSLGDSFGFDPLQSGSDALFMAAVLKGSVAQQNIRSLLDNPWQLLRDDEEPGDFADVPAGGSYTADTSESVTATDGCSVLVIAAAGITEQASAVDAWVASATSAASATESAGAAEIVLAASTTLAAGITESAAASDQRTAALTATAGAAEALAAADAAAATALQSASVAEMSAAADSVAPAGATVSAAIGESASAADVAGASAMFASALAEAGVLGDVLSAALVAAAAMSEAMPALDAASGNLVATVELGDLLAVLDASGAYIPSGQVPELTRFVVSAENRLYLIAPDERRYVISAEPRNYTVN